MSDLSLLWRSIRAENRLFWRTPIGAFFTIGLPLVMLVLFVALFGNDPIGTSYGEIATAQFYAAGLGVPDRLAALVVRRGHPRRQPKQRPVRDPGQPRF